MKTKIEIKSIFGNILFTYEKENATIKDAVEQAVSEKVNLAYANLRSADLESADLESANLHSADLESANLHSADLHSADLRSANLRSANLRSADLESADLRSANLRSADLRSADLRSANLRSADLESAENTETAYMPMFCKWSISIKGDVIQIGCKNKTIAEWDCFFASDEVFSTPRNSEDFKRIYANYIAVREYYKIMNQ